MEWWGKAKGSYPSIKRMISMGIKQAPKMNVLYHIRPYFVVIFTYIGFLSALYVESVPPF